MEGKSAGNHGMKRLTVSIRVENTPGVHQHTRAAGDTNNAIPGFLGEFRVVP
jgi:hypothetical protein